MKIVNYIDQHYKENLSIQVLADHFYVSQSYLSRYFKQNFGTTIKNILIVLDWKKQLMIYYILIYR